MTKASSYSCQEHILDRFYGFIYLFLTIIVFSVAIDIFKVSTKHFCLHKFKNVQLISSSLLVNF